MRVFISHNLKDEDGVKKKSVNFEKSKKSNIQREREINEESDLYSSSCIGSDTRRKTFGTTHI